MIFPHENVKFERDPFPPRQTGGNKQKMGPAGIAFAVHSGTAPPRPCSDTSSGNPAAQFRVSFFPLSWIGWTLPQLTCKGFSMAVKPMTSSEKP